MRRVRFLYTHPEGTPALLFKHGTEGRIPYFAAWEDGSVYLSHHLSAHSAKRRFIGPVFGTDEWVEEGWSW